MANYDKERMGKKINHMKHTSEPLHYKFVKSDLVEENVFFTKEDTTTPGKS
jgi:hypothetical protein